MPDIERIAELKLKLEERRERLRERLQELDETLELVNEKLQESSFATAEEMLETQEPTPQRAEPAPSPEEPEAREVELLREDGELISSGKVSPGLLRIIILEPFQIPLDTRPIRYLIRTLDSYAEDDYRLVEQGDLREDEKLSYSAKEDEGSLKELRVRNYRTDERLKDITGKARWAIRTVFSEIRGAGTTS